MSALTKLLFAAFAIPAALSVLALAARWWWLLELTTHFRWHYAVVFAIGTALCIVTKHWKLAAACAVLGLFNSYFVAPVYFWRAPAVSDGVPVRIMSVNAFCANRDRELLLEYVAEVSPDVLLVMEVDGGWSERLKALRADYPYHLIVPRPQDCFGIALFSRLPAVIEARYLGEADVPTIYARFEREDRDWFHLIGSHPLPPVSATYSNFRNGQLAELGYFAETLNAPTVLLGDFNVTSWSPYFYDLIAGSGLLDSRKGFGNQPSWPSDYVWAGIAIDHVLVSRDIGVQDRKVGPDVGSDHRPVIVELVIPTKETPEDAQ